jgi:hypothetical protein
MADTNTKPCKRCGEEKSIAAFQKDSQKADGLRSYCKDCCRYLQHEKLERKKTGKRVARIGPNLTAEQMREFFTYDPDTGEIRNAKARSHTHADKVVGCINSTGYLLCTIGGVKYRAHRLAWLYVYGKWPDGHIDHINRNRLDNRICNLRDVTAVQNHQNRQKATSTSSGRLGVTYSSRAKAWRAKITVNHKVIHLGDFKDLDAAIRAREASERQYGFSLS